MYFDMNTKLDVLCDMMASNLEKSFINILTKNPNDKLTRKVYLDFLKERGREETIWLVENKLYPHGSIRQEAINAHGVLSGHQTVNYPKGSPNYFIKIWNDYEDFDLCVLRFSGGIGYDRVIGNSGYIPYPQDPTNFKDKVQQANYNTYNLSCGSLSIDPYVPIVSGYLIGSGYDFTKS